MTKIIGISGVARSGKDTLALAIRSEYDRRHVDARIYSFAAALKEDLKTLIWDKIGIDIFTATGAQKEAIRPLMVGYGSMMRKLTNGKYWLRILAEKIFHDKPEVAIISDLRFAQHDEDEAAWVQKNGGTVIHLTRFTELGPILPPNDEEAFNDPFVYNQSDLKVSWDTFGDDVIEKASDFVSKMFKNHPTIF